MIDKDKALAVTWEIRDEFRDSLPDYNERIYQKYLSQLADELMARIIDGRIYTVQVRRDTQRRWHSTFETVRVDIGMVQTRLYENYVLPEDWTSLCNSAWDELKSRAKLELRRRINSIRNKIGIGRAR